MKSALERYFRSGWAFFVPYTIAYLLGAAAAASPLTLRNIFFALHAAHIALSLYVLATLRKKPSPQSFGFAGLLVLLFAIPGAYLEFPSDAWEHFFRIYTWNTLPSVTSHPYWHKFAYFFDWSLVGGLSPEYRRMGADLIGVFWQCLLAYQFYLLAFALGFSQNFARLQALASVALFGSNIFSFYRYYALSSTPLSFLALLAAMRIVLTAGRRRPIAVALLIGLMATNHLQEILLFGIFLVSLGAFHLWTWGDRKWGTRFRQVFLAVVVLCIFSGPLASIIPQIRESLVAMRPFYNSRGMLRILSHACPFVETMALHGLAAIALSLALFRRQPRLAFLAAGPLFMLFLPPTIIVFTKFADLYTAYRVLYAFPLSLAFVGGLRELLAPTFGEKKSLVIIAGIVFIVGAIPFYPVRGRLWFSLHVVPEMLSLRPADVMPSWLAQHPRINPECLLASDEVTDFLLVANFKHPRRWTARPSAIVPERDLPTTSKFLQYHQRGIWCGILKAEPAALLPVPDSRVGALSNHWGVEVVRQNWRSGDLMAPLIQDLARKKWHAVPVAPFFTLWLPPSVQP